MKLLYQYKTKKCSACRRWKEANKFYIQNGLLNSYCKKCKSKKACSRLTKEEKRKYNKSYIKNYPDNKRNGMYKFHYGITVTQYNEMLKNQHNKCATCRVPQTECIRRFAVDHDHKKDIVRGLLCHKCNLAIGLLNDDVKLVEKIKLYLGGVS